MKYGVLYYKDTDNIGDDIQSYAASRFLPKIDYMIDRESLETFTPDKKEQVKVIMNAWYIHDKFNFDISPYILPHYVSMFMKNFPYEAGITIGSDYINENVKNSLSKYSPIGTRDLHTKKLMDKLGIDSYFSGCMTLTLNRFDDVEKKDYIVTVALSEKEVNYIRKHTNREVIEFVQDVEKGSFSNESWEERKKRVEETLRLYQGAHMVITTKLHCSLPSLALGTPVLLLYDTSFKETKDRIGSFLPYLNHMNRSEFTKSNLDFEHPKKNSNKYLELRKKLEDSCYEFINKNFEKENLPDPDTYLYYINKSRNMRKMPIEQLTKLQKTYEKECTKSTKMYDELIESKKKYDTLTKNYWELDEKYQKTFRAKLGNFVRKIKK